MRFFISCLFLLIAFTTFGQTLQDDFDTNGIATWYGDDCGLDTNFANPYIGVANPSAKVLQYNDIGGTYANVAFNTGFSLNLKTGSTFSLKLYVPSTGITGSQPNQISLKLQNGESNTPWASQCEIIKPILLDQWQTISFNFAVDNFVNLDPNSANPMERWDFSRVLLQINGENNNAKVLAYIDDFVYNGAKTINNYLVWGDEFNGNGGVDATKWYHQTQLPNGSSWYNNELQHYTNKTTNAFMNNGALNIVAKKESYTDQGETKGYTSARLNSKFAFKYGRVEARAKLPSGKGTWPAIWMLGKNVIEPGAYWSATHGTTAWPACGEIDIMEHWGTNQNVISSAVHHPVNGNLGVSTYSTNAQTKPGVSNNFHVYAVEWDAESITFSVDGINHMVYKPAIRNQYTWPFDAEQFLLLNVAIEPSVTAAFTQSALELDYIRVFQKNGLSINNTDKIKKATLHPNPVDNRLIISQSENRAATLEVYSMLGQKVMSVDIRDKETIMDFSTIKNGIYSILIISKDGIESHKLVKK